jgi:hypothetical protein
MILWSIQHSNQLKEFEETCVLLANKDHVDKDFQSSYDWLVTKMQHIPNLYQVEYPVWAWKNWYPDRAKPDLRKYTRQGKKGENLIRIEFEVDDSEVLVTDFDYWHSVLNYSYIHSTQAEEDEWSDGDWNDPKWKYSDDEIIKSWDNLFNLGDRAMGSNQACVWQIKKEQVRKIDHYKTR